MPFVYVLRCADNSLYIGATEDLDARVAGHNDGASTFTALRRPVTLVFHEQFATMKQALERERQLKRWTRAKKEALVTGDFHLLKGL